MGPTETSTVGFLGASLVIAVPSAVTANNNLLSSVSKLTSTTFIEDHTNIRSSERTQSDLDFVFLFQWLFCQSLIKKYVGAQVFTCLLSSSTKEMEIQFNRGYE